MTEVEEVGFTTSYPLHRSVSKRFKVHPGKYIVIPSTSKYNEEGEYFLRIFTDQKSDHMVVKYVFLLKKNFRSDCLHILSDRELKVNKENLVSTALF